MVHCTRMVLRFRPSRGSLRTHITKNRPYSPLASMRYCLKEKAAPWLRFCESPEQENTLFHSPQEPPSLTFSVIRSFRAQLWTTTSFTSPRRAIWQIWKKCWLDDTAKNDAMYGRISRDIYGNLSGKRGHLSWCKT